MNAQPRGSPVDAGPETGYNRIRTGAVAGLVGVAFVAVVLRVHPPGPGAYPACPLLTLSGVECPLCGGLRAGESLARADSAAALDHNALVAAGIVGTVAALLVMLASPSAAQRLRAAVGRLPLWRIATGVVLVFWVARLTVLPGLAAGTAL